MDIIILIAGLLVIIGSIIACSVSVVRTPDHLRGWYGKMYGTIAFFGILGGIILLVVLLFLK